MSMPPPGRPDPSEKAVSSEAPLRLQVSLYTTAFFGHSGSSLVSVVVPLWLIVIETPPVLIGLILGIRHLPSLLFAIYGGALFDRLGARTVLYVSAVIAMVTPIFYPILPWIGPLIALQMIGGYSENITWIGAQALIGQRLKGDPVYSGRLTFASRMGSFIGPPAVGAMWDLTGPWGGFAFLALWNLGTVTGAMLLPNAESESDSPRSTPGVRALLPRLNDYLDAFHLMAIPAIALVVVVSILRVVRNGIEQSFYVVYLQELGLSATLIGILLAASNVSGAASSLVVGRVVSFFNANWLVLAAMALSVLAMTITPLIPNYALLFMAACVIGGTVGIGQPLLITITAKAAGPEAQGKAVGLRSTANRFSATFIPIIMGGLVELVGMNNSFFVLGGGTLLMFCGVAWWVWRTPALYDRG